MAHCTGMEPKDKDSALPAGCPGHGMAPPRALGTLDLGAKGNRGSPTTCCQSGDGVHALPKDSYLNEKLFEFPVVTGEKMTTNQMV